MNLRNRKIPAPQIGAYLGKLVVISAFVALLGCTANPVTGVKKIAGVIPIPFTGHTNALKEGSLATLKEGSSNGEWMFQALAVTSLASLVVLTLLGGGRPPKGSIAIAVGAFGISAWGLMMDSLQRTANLYIPWIVGIALFLVAADFGVGIWKKRKACKKPKTQT